MVPVNKVKQLSEIMNLLTVIQSLWNEVLPHLGSTIFISTFDNGLGLRLGLGVF